MDLSIKIDVTKKAKRWGGGVSLFSVIRNETYFLPFFLAHYRNLGVENFLIYDDHSDDGTTEYVANQDDCTIITSDREFGEKISSSKRMVHALKALVPEQFFPERWVVTVDADEFMLLPSPFQTLTELTTELDRHGGLCVTAPMVDFYPERLSQRNHSRAVDPFVASNYFDEGPLYEWKPGATKPKLKFLGIRARLARMLYVRDPERFNSIYGSERPFIALWKVPIIKRGFGVQPIDNHKVNASPQLHTNVALAHFKFCPDIDAKVREAVLRRQYYNASIEYRFLEAVFELLNDTSLLSAQTRKFLSPKSLEEAGYLIHDVPRREPAVG
jgi:hypothetical protein